MSFTVRKSFFRHENLSVRLKAAFLAFTVQSWGLSNREKSVDFKGYIT